MKNVVEKKIRPPRFSQKSGNCLKGVLASEYIILLKSNNNITMVNANIN